MWVVKELDRLSWRIWVAGVRGLSLNSAILYSVKEANELLAAAPVAGWVFYSRRSLQNQPPASPAKATGALAGASIVGFAQSSPAQLKATKQVSSSAAKAETGTAVFYSDKLVGHPLTSGEKYDKNALTAAHRTLPLGTKVKVTNGNVAAGHLKSPVREEKP
jgi:rare lipoprotein A (peptidoglycan hydrolase)